jgi:hypothetical protein
VTNLVNTGKVKFLFKDFPTYDLPSDRASTLTAVASYSAADQGKYWQSHDELYNNWQGENTGWVTYTHMKCSCIIAVGFFLLSYRLVCEEWYISSS